MNRENFKLLMLIALCVVLSITGIRLFEINKSNSLLLQENIQYLKLLNDPTINVNGTSRIGKPFYNFSLKDLYGKSYQLACIASLFKMIIVFDINDCDQCLIEYRLWKKLNETYQEDELMILGICPSREKQAIINFIKDRKIEFPILWDPERKVNNHMEFRMSPLRILLDQNNAILDIEHTLTTVEHQQYIISMVDSLIRNTSK